MGVELPRRVDTVYLGGGTPSLLAPELLARLFAALRSEFEFDRNAEITVECAPGQLADETLAALAAAGVNRVSLGVQSFIDREAHASGRLHSRAIVADDLRRLRAAGIANLNVDLIAGLAGQTFDSWQESLEVLIDSGVPHASVYMLEVDEDSRLGREMLSGGVRYRAGLVPSDDAIAQMYGTAIERLAAAGLANMRFPTSRGRVLNHSTICAIGIDGPIWGSASTRLQCCAPRRFQGNRKSHAMCSVQTRPTTWPHFWPVRSLRKRLGFLHSASTRRHGSSVCASTTESAPLP